MSMYTNQTNIEFDISSSDDEILQHITLTSLRNNDNISHNNDNNNKPSPANKRRKSSNKKQEWKKLLWYKQVYEDNYTDSSFLSQLKRNSTVVNYSYWKLIKDFSLIVLHLSLIMSVNLVFFGIYKLNWNPVKPTIISSFLTILCFIIYVVTLKIRRNRELIDLQKLKIKQLSNTFTIEPPSLSINLEEYLTEPSSPSFFSTFKSSILILLYLLTLSPVLKSLTNSTASDSIWALSAWLCILNVFFNDYQIDYPIYTRFDKEQKLRQHLSTLPNVVALANGNSNSSLQNKSNLSKNISLSNAIVLASRLNSNLSAFCFILFSIQVCGLFPVFNNFTRRCQFWSFHWFQIISIVVCVDVTILTIFGWGVFLSWVSLHFIIVFVGPWYFLTLQKYKDELQGPWDPAKPIVKSI